MFEDYGALAPLHEAAELLATHEWPRRYDPEVLRTNEVPVTAAIYADDPLVERAFSEETAALIRGARPWLTSEYEHNAVARGRRPDPRPARPRARARLTAVTKRTTRILPHHNAATDAQVGAESELGAAGLRRVGGAPDHSMHPIWG